MPYRQSHEDVTLTQSATWTKRIEYDSSARAIYVGNANPKNSATDQPVWQIQRLSYNGSDTSPNLIQWADGDDLFNNIWDSRASYSYQ